MKREAVGSTKMKRLCQRLSIRQFVAVGILESLWHLTAKEAPQGDIGKLSNEDIALGIDWPGDPEELIQALVVCRWLDMSRQCRIVVHDWHEHADDATKKKLARKRLCFLSVPPLSDHVPTKSDSGSLPGAEPEPEPGTGPEPGPGPAPEAVGPPTSVDARILCESVGIFAIREQEAVLRLMVAYAKSRGLDAEAVIRHVQARCTEYDELAPSLDWQYGSRYKFLMSGKWDDPRAWPRAEPKNGTRGEAQARWDAFKANGGGGNETA